jgi:hypothetical protein
VERQLELLQHLRRRLVGLARAIENTRDPSIDELIEAMEATMQASFFTPDQLARARSGKEPGILSAEVWEYLKRAFAVGFGSPR